MTKKNAHIATKPSDEYVTDTIKPLENQADLFAYTPEGAKTTSAKNSAVQANNSNKEAASTHIVIPEKKQRPTRTKQPKAQTVTMMGAVEKPEIKPTSFIKSPTIMSATGKLQLTPQNKQLENDMIELKQSQRGTTLTGTVCVIEESKHMGIVAVVMHGGYKVMIPAAQFKIFPPFDESKGYNSVEHMQRAILNKHLDAQIDYMIYPNPESIVIKDSIAIASRLAAMRSIKQDAWIAKDRRGLTKIQNGTVIEARVVNVPFSAAVVEIQGVEFMIPRQELSWQLLKDATTKFWPGQTIEVVVRDIHITEDGQVTAHVSHKEAVKNPQEIALMHLQEGSTGTGRVTVTTKDGCYVILEQGAEVKCDLPKFTIIPKAGDRVHVKINVIDMTTLRAKGDIQRVYER